jgi:RNA recognition motif-containing protein
MGTRVFIGRLPSRATERDVEHFFRGNGRIREVVLKTGFGFVVSLHFTYSIAYKNGLIKHPFSTGIRGFT